MQLNVAPEDLKVGLCRIRRCLDNDKHCREIYKLTVTTQNTMLIFKFIGPKPAHTWVAFPHNEHTETCQWKLGNLLGFFAIQAHTVFNLNNYTDGTQTRAYTAHCEADLLWRFSGGAVRAHCSLVWSKLRAWFDLALAATASGVHETSRGIEPATGRPG